MPRSSSGAARCSKNGSQRPRHSSVPGVRQRQSDTKAFVNARRSSTPVRDQGIRQCQAFVNASQRPRHSSMPFGGCPQLWTNMLLCASVFEVSLHLCYVCRFRCMQNLCFVHLCSQCALHLCSVCKLVVCQFLTLCICDHFHEPNMGCAADPGPCPASWKRF